MYEFKLPDIGEGLHEAELLEWDVKVGDTVAEGDSIAQVSTDKVNVDLPSPRSGVITELPWNPGDVIPVGEVLACIDDGKGGPADSEEKATAPNAESSPAKVKRAERSRVRAAPAVRRYAADKGVDLAAVEATGPGGTVTKDDIENHLAASGATGESVDRVGVSREKLSGPRLAAAKRLEESWRTLATTAMTFEVAADALVDARDRLAKDMGEERISPLAVIARCLCAALAEHPKFNAVIDEKARALDIHASVHLGLAVDGPDGLLVPVIRDVQDKSVLDLVRAIADRADKARSGELSVEDFRGSTFTISSTGSLEEAAITATTPVINFPNIATLWVSRIRERPRVIDGEITAGPMLNCTLAFDHRFIQGADATRFINTLDKMLSKPPSAHED